MRSLPPDGNFAGLVNLAVLHYNSAPNAHPKVDPTVNIPVSASPLVETNLHVRVCLGVFPSTRLKAFYPATQVHTSGKSCLSACLCFGC